MARGRPEGSGRRLMEARLRAEIARREATDPSDPEAVGVRIRQSTLQRAARRVEPPASAGRGLDDRVAVDVGDDLVINHRFVHLVVGQRRLPRQRHGVVALDLLAGQLAHLGRNRSGDQRSPSVGLNVGGR